MSHYPCYFHAFLNCFLQCICGYHLCKQVSGYFYPLVSTCESPITFPNAKLKSVQDRTSLCLDPTDVSNYSEKLFSNLTLILKNFRVNLTNLILNSFKTLSNLSFMVS